MTCEVLCQDLAACRQRGVLAADRPAALSLELAGRPTGGNNHQPQRPNARTRGGSFAEQWQIGWHLH